MFNKKKMTLYKVVKFNIILLAKGDEIMCDSNIESSVLRYIVPFSLGQDFESSISRVENFKGDVRPRLFGTNKKKDVWKLDTSNSSESDLYSYIKDEFYKDDNSDSKIGYSYSMDRNVVSNDIPEIQWLKDNKWNSFKFTNIGLYIFRNSLGFIWYEIGGIEDLGINDLISFQNTIKEINHNPGDGCLWIKSQSTNNVLSIYREKDNDNNKDYFIPFSIGDWINQLLSNTFNKSIDYIAPRKNHFNEKYLNGGIKQLQKYYEIKEKEESTDKECKGNTEENKLIIKKSEDNKLLEILEENNNYYVADKAILFTYVCNAPSDILKDSYIDDKKKAIAYHLTNGYSDSYICSDEVGKEILQPFGNVTWFATSEGCSIIAYPCENEDPEEKKSNNLSFFSGGFKTKVSIDYFHIFIKVLYQSYSLLIFSRDVQNNLSAIRNVYSEIHENKANKEMIEKNREEIKKLSININLFLTKNVTTSISHINHQNVFYNYVLKCLRVDEESKTVLTGLSALNEFVSKQNEEDEKKFKEEEQAEKEKKDARVNSILGLVAIFEALSVINDWQDIKDAGINAFVSDPGSIVISIIVIITTVITIDSIIKAFKKND